MKGGRVNDDKIDILGWTTTLSKGMTFGHDTEGERWQSTPTASADQNVDEYIGEREGTLPLVWLTAYTPEAY